MVELHMKPNVEYLKKIEDELYQYAVEHPEEYLKTNMEMGDTDFLGSWPCYIVLINIMNMLVSVELKFVVEKLKWIR